MEGNGPDVHLADATKAMQDSAMAAQKAADIAQIAATRAFQLGILQIIFGGGMAALTALGVGYMALKQAEIGKSQRVMAETVITLEKNTNSIKDALVEKTELLGKAQGNIEGRKELKAEMKKENK